ncbi:MAG: manganese-binding transcriptional regulator MntR [Pseudomonadota bacterium]|nr:manganese-binding transcriptional regulator MntR [Pseudomonadota bacterium]
MDKDISDSVIKFERIRKAHQSEVAEDYVEMIADLIAETGEARAVDLAARFGVTAPTVNATVQRLQKDGLVTAKPYRSIFLTKAGQELALYCKERHQIVRNFLISIGVDENTAEQDAEGIEHHVSPETLEKFTQFVASQGKSQN